MNLRVSPVFWANLRSNTRYTVNEGGARSGKTYSILQVLIYIALSNKGKIIDIVRKTQRELRDTVMIDFFEILNSMGLYNARQHNRTNLEYVLNGNLFRFIGLDKAQKKRGSKRHILYCNEANGLTLEDWIQLSIRTTERIFIDYNPSEEFWVDKQVIDRGPEKTTLIHSTYLDNYDFLPKEQIEEIENLIKVDDFYYQVYALGKRAPLKGKIYTKLNKITEQVYDDVFEDVKFYGLDFGYEHATVLTEIKWAAEQTWEKAVYFEKHKTDDQLIEWMNKEGISQTLSICADPAYPASIAKLRDAGYQVRKAKKDIRDGIHFCQAIKRNIVDTPNDYYKQNNMYKYRQTPDGHVIEEPVKRDDDAPDAFRYGAYTTLREFFNPMGMQ